MTWKSVALKECVEFLDNLRVPVKEENRKEGIYPYYGANGIQGYVDDYIFDEELLLLAEDGGHFGSKTRPIAYLVSGKCWVNNHAHVLKAKDNCCLSYLHKVLMFYDVSNYISGSTRKKLNKGKAELIPILLPPLKMQQRIATVIDKVSILIEKRKEQITVLDKLEKDTFLDMFGDSVMNPMGWKTRELSNICKKILGGGTPSKSKPEYYIGSIPWVTPKDMKTNYIFNSIDHITETAINESSAKLIPTNSLLMVIRSGILKHTLPIAINKVEVAINQDMKAFIVDEEFVLPNYLFGFFRHYQRKLLDSVRAVTADNIDFSIIKSLQVPLPPIELQRYYVEKINTIEAQKTCLKASLAQLEIIYKSTMQKSFNGELFQGGE